MEVDNKEGLASKNYWDKVWLGTSQQLRQLSTNSFIDRRFCELFNRFFEPDREKSLIEIGCVFSKYLKYFSEKYGYQVSGLDYSELGCEATALLLKKHGIDIGGRIYCRNIFWENQDLVGKFDIVSSFGVVEHFSHARQLIDILRDFLKDGGIIITEIPNTSSFIFSLYKYVNKFIYDKHCIIDREKLTNIHRDCGFEILFCNYYGSLNYGVLNFKHYRFWVQRILKFVFRFQHEIFWRIFDKFKFYPETKVFSPYIVCIAKKRHV